MKNNYMFNSFTVLPTTREHHIMRREWQEVFCVTNTLEEENAPFSK